MQPADEVQKTIQEDLEKNNIVQDDSSQHNPSNNAPSSIMLLSDLNQLLESNNPKKGQSLIFKRNFKNVAEHLILDSYIEMMESKPIWTACIRESRTLGLISITVKTDEKVTSFRLGFINGKWQNVSDEQIKANNTNSVKLGNENISRDTIANGCQDLLDCIFASIPQLTLERFILPLPEEETVEKEYIKYDYKTSKVTMFNIHNNPVDILIKVAALFDKILANFEAEIKNEDVYLLQESFSKVQNSEPDEKKAILIECFSKWLESKNLHHDVTSAISLSLLDKPRVLDSGHVFSKDDLMHNGHPIERCPMTRTIIDTTPSRLPNWERNLKLCLDKFTQLLNKFDEKALVTELEFASSGVGLSSAGFFAVSNEREQTSSQNNNSPSFP